MVLPATALDGGFASPVFDAQSVFRAVMDAMARPGEIRAVGALAEPPQPLSATAAALLLTLCDQDTPLWLDAALAEAAPVAAWIGFHTGAPVVADPAEAAFAVAARPETLPTLDGFAEGSQEFPDRSATLILQVASLDGGAVLTLEGPGIETTARLAPTPLPPRFLDQWRRNGARFPRGVDLVLAAPGALACLPRTTRIREGSR